MPKFEFKLIPHHDILIPAERARKDFGDIEGFARSILAAGGLKQNLVVEPSRSLLQISYEHQTKFDLVAGERRYRALREILSANSLVWLTNKPTPEQLAEWAQIPCKIEYNLTETERKLYELVENVDRKDFVWQERCLLFNEIHDLCIKQHGKGTVGRGKTGWSLQDTADLVGKSKATLGEEIQMAKQLLGDPLLGDITRRSSAKIKMKRQAYERVADFLEIGKQDAPHDMHLYCGKSEVLLNNEEEFPLESFDLIITTHLGTLAWRIAYQTTEHKPTTRAKVKTRKKGQLTASTQWFYYKSFNNPLNAFAPTEPFICFTPHFLTRLERGWTY